VIKGYQQRLTDEKNLLSHLFGYKRREHLEPDTVLALPQQILGGVAVDSDEELRVHVTTFPLVNPPS
jgi:hypothetical protein